MDLTVGELVIWAVVIWILSQIVLGVIDGYRILHLSNRVEFLKKLNDTIHQVKVEKQGEIEYWFDADDDRFLGQGKTIDEVINHIKSRFPDHIFLIQGVGGVAKQTDWKLLDIDEFKKVKLTSSDN